MTSITAFIGSGNMARSLIGGLVDSGTAPESILASDPDAAQRQRLTEQFKVRTCDDNTTVAETADVLVMAVKPQVMREALLPLGPIVRERQPLLISIAAGVTIDSMTAWIGGEPAIVRVMPNTPALVGAGASGLFANEAVSNAQREVAQSIMQAVGVSVWVSREARIDTVTAVSGSGPAYFFYLMEAIEAAGVAGGLTPDIARRLTLQTALGAAKLAIASDEPVAELRRRVTSPAGTTERAIQFLESAGANETIQRAVEAARIRSEELAQLEQED